MLYVRWRCECLSNEQVFWTIKKPYYSISISIIKLVESYLWTNYKLKISLMLIIITILPIDCISTNKHTIIKANFKDIIKRRGAVFVIPSRVSAKNYAF